MLGSEEEYNKAPSPADYVGIIHDVLLMKKNVGILFHMAKVEACLKTAEFYAESTFYIDVWLWPHATQTEAERRTSELLLQLVWIIRQVKRWKKVTQIRVLATTKMGAHATIQQAAADTVHAFVSDLRIEAVVETLELGTLHMSRACAFAPITTFEIFRVCILYCGRRQTLCVCARNRTCSPYTWG
jgi:hypothetical protein